MVEKVKHIQPELQTNPFANLPILLQREVGADEFRPVAETERLVPHGSDGLTDYRKSRWVIDVRPRGSTGATGSREGRTPVRSRSPWRTLVAGAVQRVQPQRGISSSNQCGCVFR